MFFMKAGTLTVRKSATHEDDQETPLFAHSRGSPASHSAPPDPEANRKPKSGILTSAPINPVPESAGNATGDRLTAWWQNRLGKQAVLGQMGNRTRLEHQVRLPILIWTKPAVDSTHQEEAVGRVTSGLVEGETGNLSGAQHHGSRAWAGNTLGAIGRVAHRSGVMFGGALLFLAVVILRVVSAVVFAGCAIIAFVRNAVGRARQ